MKSSPRETATTGPPPMPRTDATAGISVRIDRLVLDGLALGPGDAGRLRTAVEAELGRLLAEGGVSPVLSSGAALPVVDAGGFEVDPGGPMSLGRQIARAVYREIGT